MHPILNQIGMIFIPVSHIEKARDWYCKLLGVPADGEVLFDHLYIVPMDGINIVLDSKIYSPDVLFKTPPFHFNTNDVNAAYEWMKELNIEIVTDVEFDQWFNFKDPDGNVLMVCHC